MIHLPNIAQWSVVAGLYNVGDTRVDVYLIVPGVDHVCIRLDADGNIVKRSLYIRSIKAFITFEMGH